MITGPQGFDRTVTFDLAEEPAVITQRTRETIEDRRRKGCPVAAASRASSCRGLVGHRRPPGVRIPAA
jgi:hypothetical protein